MRHFLIISGFLIANGLAASSTALDALKLLPKEHRARMARIEGREGSPEPERWHILVNDRDAQNGLREFVVADGAIVAERGISQFAESLAADQVIGDAVRFNSDRAAQIVQQYAQANGVTVGSIAYQLRKDAGSSVPLWRLTCYDRVGRELGSITVTGTKGAVISHQGFPIEPAAAVAEKQPERQTQRQPEKPREKPRPAPTAQVVRAATPIPVAQPPPPEPPPKKPLIKRLFGVGQPE